MIVNLSTVILAATTFPSIISAFTFFSRETSNLAVVSSRFEKKKTPISATSNPRRRRDDTIDVDITNLDNVSYIINVTIGTPPQEVSLILDTGSSDAWVNVDTSAYCVEHQGRKFIQADDSCGQFGTYEANSSSSYQYYSGGFQIRYQDGTSALGDYATDTFSFGGVKIPNQRFAIAYNSANTQGILGIGYATDESLSAGQSTYPNVPQSLLNLGAIKSNSYSLWLNSIGEDTGEILFGGINAAKFQGELSILPVLPVSGTTYVELEIALTGVGINGQAGSITGPIAIPAVLDSGTSLIYLPYQYASEIFNALGLVYNQGAGYALIDCKAASNSATSFQFSFSTLTITIPFSELVIPLSSSSRTCAFAIAVSAQNAPALLGDAFLRSTYVVYDLTHNQIALGQTVFDSTEDKILEIDPISGIPSASTLAGLATTVLANTAAPHIGLHTSSTAAAGMITPAPILKFTGLSGAALAAGAVAAFVI